MTTMSRTVRAIKTPETAAMVTSRLFSTDDVTLSACERGRDFRRFC